MTLNNQELEFLSYIDCEIRYEYSGRGMYGKTTTGIVCDSRESLIEELTKQNIGCEEDESTDYKDRLELISKISNARIDNMGYSVILY